MRLQFRRRLCLSLSALVLFGLAPGIARGDGAAAGRLSGLIEDGAGAAFSGARVHLADKASGALVTTAVADDQGRFSATAAVGRYDLAVSAERGGSTVAAQVRDVDVGADSRLNVAVAGAPVQIVTFRGTVRDASGVPLPFVRISAGGQTVTDNDGRFVLEVASGRYPLTAGLWSDAGVVEASVAEFDLTRDRTVDLSLPVISVDVSVRDDSGAPLPGATVSIQSEETCSSCSGAFELYDGARTTRRWRVSRRTGADGHVRLAGLPSSDFTLSAYPGDQYDNRVTLTGRKAGAATTFEVVIPARSPPPPSMIFSGFVRDLGGMLDPEPDGYVHVSLADGDHVVAQDEPAEDGSFDLSAASGSHTLTVDADSSELHHDHTQWRPDADSVRLAVKDFELRADRREDLRIPLVGFAVRVLDAAGQPVAGAWVESESDGSGATTGELFPGARTTGSFRSDRWTDATGIANIRVLPGRPATVSVDPPAGQGLPAKARISAGATSLEVRIAGALTLQGHIRTPEGGAVWPGPDGWLRPESGPAYRFAIGADGAYAVSAPAGRYRIDLDTEDFFYAPSDDADYWTASSDRLDLTGDTTLDLTVPAHAAHVRAVDADGWPQDGEFDWNASGSSVADFVLAPGIRARSTFAAWGPNGSSSLSLSPLAPSRAEAHFWPLAGYPDLSFPGLYVAPGEETVIAYAAGSRVRPPGAPQDVRAVAFGDGTATVTWNPPASDGGTPLLGYLVTASGDDVHHAFVAAPATAGVVTGLTPATGYRFHMTAVNARGAGDTGWGGSLVTPESAGVPPTSTETPLPAPGPAPKSAPDPISPAPARSGYWMLGADGIIYRFGAAADHGAPSHSLGGARAVDLEPTPTGDGYWVLDDAGRVSAHGDATSLGHVDRSRLSAGEMPTSLSATPTGKGYWVFTDRGRLLNFGDAPHQGDMAGTPLNGAVLDSVATASGQGYWMVAADGGIFSFGDAKFYGSMGGKRLNKPVMSMAPDPDGAGYWLVASDGGIFSFDAPFYGSMGATKLNKPITGMVTGPAGYLMVAEDGGIFAFGEVRFHGSLGSNPPPTAVVAVALLG